MLERVPKKIERKVKFRSVNFCRFTAAPATIEFLVVDLKINVKSQQLRWLVFSLRTCRPFYRNIKPVVAGNSRVIISLQCAWRLGILKIKNYNSYDWIIIRNSSQFIYIRIYKDTNNQINLDAKKDDNPVITFILANEVQRTSVTRRRENRFPRCTHETRLNVPFLSNFRSLRCNFLNSGTIDAKAARHDVRISCRVGGTL